MKKFKILCLSILVLPLAGGCQNTMQTPPLPTAQAQTGEEASRTNEAIEQGLAARSLELRRNMAEDADLNELNDWWKSRNIGDPHKYLLPPMLAELSLTPADEQQPIWDIWLDVERNKSDLYHFRSIYDVRIFFLFRDSLPDSVRDAYRSMLASPRVFEWQEGGTENHISQQYISGLALMDGSNFPIEAPHLMATNEAWLRAELGKYLTIGQGEFHSSTYYSYTIGALLNLYDFAQTPQRRELAKAALDWLATNMALRLSWGTAGGAESRGFDRNTWNSGISAVAWVWWGPDDRRSIDRIASQMRSGNTRLAVLAATSSYRPPAHLRSLAQKTLPLPFQLQASHPAYYTYHADNQFWETFYVTDDYSLGTLTIPGRSYQVQGTINAQYATYKLVVRDPQGQENAVVSLGGTYHSPGATGRSPGDRYLQEKGATIYQLRLNAADLEAGVPARSHLVLPRRYGEPQQFGEWYVWRVENIWLCARPWGDSVEIQDPVSEKAENYLALAALGDNTAWIVDVASVDDYPTAEALQVALDEVEIEADNWDSQGELAYTSLAGDRLQLRYESGSPLGTATVNGTRRQYLGVPVLESPYVNQDLNSGRLEVNDPRLGRWQLQLQPGKPVWEID